MNLEPPKTEIKSATRVTGGPATPRKGPPKFKQRQTRQFKSKPPKKGVQGWAVNDAQFILRAIEVIATYGMDVINFFLCSFGDDIPGMEGLGTGEFNWGFTYQFLCSAGVWARSHLGFVLQTSPSFAPGRPLTTWSCTSWPSTASSEPSHISLQSPKDYRPCTSNHLPLGPTRSFKWNSSKQTNTTNCNKYKKWKKRKNVPKKLPFYPLTLDSSSDSALHTQHLLMFRICCVDSHIFTRFALSLYKNSIRFSSLALQLSSPFLFFSFLLTDKTWNLRKQGSLKLSLSDKPVKWVGSHFMCLGASFNISEVSPLTLNISNTKPEFCRDWTPACHCWA